MDETVTPEEVWRLFKATDEKLDRVIAEGDHRYAEFLKGMEQSRARADAEHDRISKRFDQVSERFDEVSERFDEVSERFDEVSRHIDDLAVKQAETWKLITENSKLSANNETLIADLTRKMGDLTRKMGDLTDRLGEFAEAMVIPALRSLLAGRGILVHRIYRHVEVSRDGKAAEFDVILVNGPTIAAVEIKSRLKVGDVTEHLERLTDFKRYFPEYRDSAVIGVVAGMVVDEDAAKFAYRQGLFVLGQSGETVTILNDDKFVPKEW